MLLLLVRCTYYVLVYMTDMVRSRVRKTDIGKTGAADMLAASKAVINRNMSLCQAASAYGIAKSTLSGYVKKTEEQWE